MSILEEIKHTKSRINLARIDKIPANINVIVTGLQLEMRAGKISDDGIISLGIGTGLAVVELIERLEKLEAKHEALRKAYTTMIGNYNED